MTYWHNFNEEKSQYPLYLERATPDELRGAPMRMQQKLINFKPLHAFAVLFAAVVLVGCLRKIDSSNVVGTYVANRNEGVDILEVKSNGTYFYTCKLGKSSDFANTPHWNNSPSGVSDFTNENHWNLHYDGDEPRITFDNFRFCARDYRRSSGFWDASVQHSWKGAIRLPIDRDVNFYFVKKSQ